MSCLIKRLYRTNSIILPFLYNFIRVCHTNQFIIQTSSLYSSFTPSIMQHISYIGYFYYSIAGKSTKVYIFTMLRIILQGNCLKMILFYKYFDNTHSIRIYYFSSLQLLSLYIQCVLSIYN